MHQAVQQVIEVLKQKVSVRKMRDGEEILRSLEYDFQVHEGFDGYGSCTVTTYDGQKVTLYNPYGDEDDDALWSFEPKNPDANELGLVLERLGFCLVHQNTIYCFDIELDGSIKKVMASKVKLSVPAKKYCGKRAFYYYRDEEFVSLRGWYSEARTGRRHIEADDWISGPRTIFALKEISLQ